MAVTCGTPKWQIYWILGVDLIEAGTCTTFITISVISLGTVEVK
jgi:hypothetical protein